MFLVGCVLSGIWGLVVVLTTMDRKYIAASSRYSSEYIVIVPVGVELCVISQNNPILVNTV